MSTPPATTAPDALTYPVYLARSHRHHRADSREFDEEIFGIFGTPEPGAKAIWKDVTDFMDVYSCLSESPVQPGIDRELLAWHAEAGQCYGYKKDRISLSCSEVNEKGEESITGWWEDGSCIYSASVKQYEVSVSPELVAQILAAEKAKQRELCEERQPREKPSEGDADADSEKVRPMKRQCEDPQETSLLLDQESEGADTPAKRQRLDSEETLAVLPEWPYPGAGQLSPLGTQSEDSDSDSQDYDYEPRSIPSSPFNDAAWSTGWTGQDVVQESVLIQLQEYDEEGEACSAEGHVEVELCVDGGNGDRISPKETLGTEM